MDLYAVRKRNKAIGYILGVEVTWVNILTEVMVGSTIKAIGIHYEVLWEGRWIADEVIDPLEVW